MKKIFFIVITLLISLNAETLFEIKDASNWPVFSISDDGLRVFNLGDTLMVISSSEIKAFIANSKDKALSRSFSVTTSTTGKAGLKALEVTAADATMHSLEVTGENARMSSTAKGPQFSYFSPENLFLGLSAGVVTTGLNNVFVGNQAGLVNSTGYGNIFIGNNTGNSNLGGGNNTFVGSSSGYKNSGGDLNVFVGYESGYSNLSSGWNTFLGYKAGYVSTGGGNTFVGAESARNLSTGDNNCYVGNNSGVFSNSGSENTCIGAHSGGGNSTGDGNVFLGFHAGYGETGSDRLYIDNSSTSAPLIHGDFATNALTINGTLNVTGNSTLSNTYVNGLLRVNSNNMALSMSPGTGADPINYIYQGMAGSSNVKEYAVAIYDPLWVSGSVWAVSHLTTSDKRFKKNIVPISNTLSKISQIDGVYFEWNDDMLKVKNNEEPEIKRDTSKQIGFIAQDIEKVFPEMVSTDGSGYKSVDYSKMSAVLLEAVKEQQQQIDMLIKEIETMKKHIK